MANVYAATRENGDRVALKILHRELASDPAMRERFKREGYFSNTIGHAGVVRALDDDTTDDGCAFLVMELLEGETLEERRRKLGGKMPLRQALDIVDNVLDILSAAHGRDVLHRDVKPDNVFIRRTGEVKLLDFGVARFNDGQSQSDMTGTGMVLGTPAFMPPEQALGRREEVDARSDLWAVGATLFVALTGQPVHAGNDAKQRLIATARRPARPIRDVAAEVPRAVASVVDRALAFDRNDRYDSANEMREALRWARRAIDGDHELPPKAISDDEQTVDRKRTAATTHEAPTARTKLDKLEETLPRGLPTDDEPTIMRMSTSKRTDPYGGAAPEPVAPATVRDAQGPESGAVTSAGPVFTLTQKKPPESQPPTRRVGSAEHAIDSSVLTSAKDYPRTKKDEKRGEPGLYNAAGSKSVEVEFTFTKQMSTAPDVQVEGRKAEAAAREAFAAIGANTAPTPHAFPAAIPAAALPNEPAVPPERKSDKKGGLGGTLVLADNPMRGAGSSAPPPAASSDVPPAAGVPAYGTYHGGFVHEDAPKVIIGAESQKDVPHIHTPIPQLTTETNTRVPALAVPAAPPMPNIDVRAGQGHGMGVNLSSAPVAVSAQPPGHTPTLPPGPALAEIMTARKRGQGLRIALTIGFGALAGLVTYIAVMRHRMASAGLPTTPASSVAVASAAPPPAPTDSSAPPASATAPSDSATPTASATPPDGDPQPVASATPPKKKKKKKPPAAAATATGGEPTAEPTSTPTATAEPTATAAPKPDPPPKLDPLPPE